MNLHELKTDPIPYRAVYDGLKTYEIRLDDRGFEIDDILLLRETKHTGKEMKEQKKPLIYTGSAGLVVVTHILRYIYGIKDGWCIMSIKRFVKEV